jgi:hypothetical protein
MNLNDFTDEELRLELNRRIEAAKAPPKPLPRPDWAPVYHYVESVVACLSKEDEYEPKDFEHYLFEKVMVAMYGPSIWKWWNSHT